MYLTICYRFFQTESMSWMVALSLLSTVSSSLPSFTTVCQTGIREDDTNYINCARRQLKEIPDFSHYNSFCDELILSLNNITHIHKGAFDGLKAKRILLDENFISHVDESAFEEVSQHLEDLIIEFTNSVTSLPFAIKHNVISLSSLKLIGMFVHSLHNDSFKLFRKLRTLSILRSSLRSLAPNSLSPLMSTLVSLDLAENQLTVDVWNELKNLQRLKYLNLSQNNIKYIPQHVFDFLSSIKLLDLSYNGLMNIHSNSMKYPSLTIEYLYLQNNELQLSEVRFVSSMKSLKEVNLDFNKIDALPPYFFRECKQLESLSLEGNEIITIDNRTFKGLSYSLKTLKLSRNRIRIVPMEAFLSLSSLENLVLDKNPLEKLAQDSFVGLRNNLVNISLQNNRLSSFDILAIRELRNIRRVKLGFNEIDDVDTETFHHDTNLTSLDLRNNKITSIPLVPNGYHLEELFLNNNKISSIDKEDLSVYPNLRKLSLTSNPLHCDCKIAWLLDWIKEKFEPEVVSRLPWTCFTPASLYDKQLTKLSKADLTCLQAEEKNLLSYEYNTFLSSKTPSNEKRAKLNKIQVDVVADTIVVVWNVTSLSDIKNFTVNYHANRENEYIYDSVTLDKMSRAYTFVNVIPAHKYTVCITVVLTHRKDRYCKEIWNTISSTSAESRNMRTHEVILNTRFVVIGSTAVILLISSLIIFCVVLNLKSKRADVTKEVDRVKKNNLVRNVSQCRPPILLRNPITGNILSLQCSCCCNEQCAHSKKILENALSENTVVHCPSHHVHESDNSTNSTETSQLERLSQHIYQEVHHRENCTSCCANLHHNK